MNNITLDTVPVTFNSSDLLVSIRNNTINPLVSASSIAISAINTLNDIKLETYDGVASMLEVSGLTLTGALTFPDGTIHTLAELYSLPLSAGSAITLTDSISPTGHIIVSVSADESTITTSVGNSLSIAQLSISSAHIANNSINGTKLINNTITFDKMGCTSTISIPLSGGPGSDLIIPTQKAVQSRINSDFMTMLLMRPNVFSELWDPTYAITAPSAAINSGQFVRNSNDSLILYPGCTLIQVYKDGWSGSGMYTTYIYALSAESVTYTALEVDDDLTIWHNGIQQGGNTPYNSGQSRIINYVPGINRVDLILVNSRGGNCRMQIRGKWIDKTNLF